MIKDDFDFIKVVNTLDFTFAKTRVKTNPHEYCWAETNDKEKLEKVRALNKYIEENGEEQYYFGETYKVLFIDGHKYWTIDFWSNTQILNRNWDYKNEDGTINTSRTDSYKSH